MTCQKHIYKKKKKKEKHRKKQNTYWNPVMRRATFPPIHTGLWRSAALSQSQALAAQLHQSWISYNRLQSSARGGRGSRCHSLLTLSFIISLLGSGSRALLSFSSSFPSLRNRQPAHTHTQGSQVKVCGIQAGRSGCFGADGRCHSRSGWTQLMGPLNRSPHRRIAAH